MYDQLKYPVKLQHKRVNLQSVNGQPLKVDGLITLKFKIGSNYCTHPFYVVPTMNRNVILGRDFLINNGVRLYYVGLGIAAPKTYCDILQYQKRYCNILQYL